MRDFGASGTVGGTQHERVPGSQAVSRGCHLASTENSGNALDLTVIHDSQDGEYCPNAGTVLLSQHRAPETIDWFCLRNSAY